MEQEIDLAIARFVREDREQKEEEERQRAMDMYDPRKNTTYTLEELMGGIRKGKQYLYTLLLEFEPRQPLEDAFTIPFIKDFFDEEEHHPQMVLLASTKRKVAMNLMYVQCSQAQQSLEEWAKEVQKNMKDARLPVKLEQSRKLGSMEYFCSMMPSAAGRIYQIMFRMQKGDRLYMGVMNCMEKEREGMGLLLEAIVCLTEEMNR